MTDFKSITSNVHDFDRFLGIIGKADKKHGLERAMVICASMLAAVESYMVGAFGPQEASAIMERLVKDFIGKARPQ